MDSLNKVTNLKLSPLLYKYLLNTNPDEESGLYLTIAHEIDSMINSGVLTAILCNYLITALQIAKVTDKYDLVTNIQKIENIFKLVFPGEIERKKHIAQIMTFCIKTGLHFQNNMDPDIKEDFNNLLDKTKNR